MTVCSLCAVIPFPVKPSNSRGTGRRMASPTGFEPVGRKWFTHSRCSESYESRIARLLVLCAACVWGLACSEPGGVYGYNEIIQTPDCPAGQMMRITGLPGERVEVRCVDIPPGVRTRSCPDPDQGIEI